MRLLSAGEQVAARLRQEIVKGSLRGEMPGIHQLASELHLHHKTVAAALSLLEDEGLLVTQGPGRSRAIVIPNRRVVRPPMRVKILDYARKSKSINYHIDLRHRLQEAGHVAEFAPKTLLELDMDPKRVARLVQRTPADAWVVVAGSLEVLEWFATQPVPSFAVFGRLLKAPIAGVGVEKVEALRCAVRRLIELGHRRIVLFLQQMHRKPRLGAAAEMFFQELAAHGIATGPYNLPDWQEDTASIHQTLRALFAHTPPTALLMNDTALFLTVLQFLAGRGLVVPRDVSMISLDPDSSFAWCDPSVAHIGWDPSPVVRAIERWVNDLSRGRNNRQKKFYPAEFVEGGTIGPAPAKR